MTYPSSTQTCGTIELQASDKAALILRIEGHWIRGSVIPPLPQTLAELAKHHPTKLIIQADIAAWDSRLPSYLFKIADYCRINSIAIDSSALPTGVQSLLKLACTVPERLDAHRDQGRQSFVTQFGSRVISLFEEGSDLVHFIGETMLAGGAMALRKARFRNIDLLVAIQEAGTGALPIVTLISLLVGLILAFVGAVQLSMFGAQIYIADLVGLGTVREMGTLMTAVIMSGRTGAAYAAQLGMMKVNNEIDALRTMGISPMEFLVLPRILALTMMMPLLCLYADLMGILGGAAVSFSIFDISPNQYYTEIHKAVHLTDFAIGLFKGLVFAVLIATAGCMRGMRCGVSASAVGDATTAAVVDSIIYIVVADSIITLICNQLHI
jgi:phospholipid/cholesterol/gamma-HCH transport system permease protein